MLNGIAYRELLPVSRLLCRHAVRRGEELLEDGQRILLGMGFLVPSPRPTLFQLWRRALCRAMSKFASRREHKSLTRGERTILSLVLDGAISAAMALKDQAPVFELRRLRGALPVKGGEEAELHRTLAELVLGPDASFLARVMVKDLRLEFPLMTGSDR